jgi:hypothetical protein
MKTLTTLLFITALSACATSLPEPSSQDLLTRLGEIRAMPCDDLQLKHLEYSALQSSDRLASKSVRISYAEINRRCKK